MDAKVVIEKALNHYLSYVKICTPFDWESKAVSAQNCLSYIQNNGIIDINWLKSNIIFADVLKTYHLYLDNLIKENDSAIDINTLREIRKFIISLKNELF